MVLFLQQFDYFGIYVIMFFVVLRTVTKVVFVASIFIIGFALSFNILLYNTYFFGGFGRSIMKTLIMMTGMCVCVCVCVCVLCCVCFFVKSGRRIITNSFDIQGSLTTLATSMIRSCSFRPFRT